MSTYQGAVVLTDLIPFVNPLKETFFSWLSLNDFHRNRVKFIVEQNNSTEIKLVVMALEQWDHLQNFGAPGVEMESVNCDNNILQDILDSIILLNEVIFDVGYTKTTDDSE